MARKRNVIRDVERIYEVNDIFSVVGYSLIWLGILAQFTNLNVVAIPVNSLWDVIKGLFTTTSGNLTAMGLGLVSLLIEKYIRYKRIL